MNYRKTSVLLSAAALAMTASAQPAFQWAKLIDGDQNEMPYTLSAYPDGSLLSASTFGSRDSNKEVVSYDGTPVGTGTVMVGNSDNHNMLIVKTDAGGNLKWAISSSQGDFSDGPIARPTADGGCIIATKTRSSTGMPDLAPHFIDAEGNSICMERWDTGDKRSFRLALLKADKDGRLEWMRHVSATTVLHDDPTSETFVADGIGLTDIAVADDGHIFLSGYNFTTLSFPKADGTTFALEPVNVGGWKGDTQVGRGSGFVAKLSPEGYYEAHVMTEGTTTYDRVSRLALEGDYLYLQGLATGEAAGTVSFGGKSLTVDGLTRIWAARLKTDDLTADWAKSLKAYLFTGKNNTTFQCKALQVDGGSLFLTGHAVGGLSEENDTEARLMSKSSLQEGYALELSAADGSWVGGGMSRQTIGGYYGVFRNGTGRIAVGYKFGTIFMDFWGDAWSAIDSSYNLITETTFGIITDVCASGDALSLAARNFNGGTCTLLGAPETITSVKSGTILAQWKLSELATAECLVKSPAATRAGSKARLLKGGRIELTLPDGSKQTYDLAGRLLK